MTDWMQHLMVLYYVTLISDLLILELHHHLIPFERVTFTQNVNLLTRSNIE